MTKILNLKLRKNINRVLVLKNRIVAHELNINVTNQSNSINEKNVNLERLSQTKHKRIAGLAIIFVLFAGGYWVVSSNSQPDLKYVKINHGFEFRKPEDSFGFKLSMGSGDFYSGIWGVNKSNTGCYVSALLVDKKNPDVAVIAGIDPMADRGGDMLYLVPFKIAKNKKSTNEYVNLGFVEASHFSSQTTNSKTDFVKVKIGVDDIEEYDAVYNEDESTPFSGYVKKGASFIKVGLPYIDFKTTKKQSYTISFSTVEGTVNIPIAYPDAIIEKIIVNNECQ